MSTFVLFGVVDIIVSERRRECDAVPVLGHEDLNNCSIPIDFSVDVDHVGYMFVFVRLVIRLVIATQQYPRNLCVNTEKSLCSQYPRNLCVHMCAFYSCRADLNKSQQICLEGYRLGFGHLNLNVRVGASRVGYLILILRVVAALSIVLCMFKGRDQGMKTG